MTSFNFGPSLDRTARFQLGATFVAAVLLPLLVGCFSLILVAASVLCSYVAIRRGYSCDLLCKPMSYSSKIWCVILFVLFVLTCLGVPLMGWLLIVGLFNLVGLNFGPTAMKLIDGPFT
jgi:hypothetical protein